MTDSRPLMLFDGVCNLCTGSVRFILRHERSERMQFAAMQSAAGQAILRSLGLPTDAFESVVLVEDGRAYTKSRAVLRLGRTLAFPWKQAAIVAYVLPRPLADWMYLAIARNRYRLFGKRSSCLMPEPGLRARFLN